jgi:hypothetical protein
MSTSKMKTTQLTEKIVAILKENCKVGSITIKKYF